MARRAPAIPWRAAPFGVAFTGVTRDEVLAAWYLEAPFAFLKATWNRGLAYDFVGDHQEDAERWFACVVEGQAYPLALCEDRLRVPGLVQHGVRATPR
jgi:hypothetical protein